MELRFGGSDVAARLAPKRSGTKSTPILALRADFCPMGQSRTKLHKSRRVRADIGRNRAETSWIRPIVRQNWIKFDLLGPICSWNRLNVGQIRLGLAQGSSGTWESTQLDQVGLELGQSWFDVNQLRPNIGPELAEHLPEPGKFDRTST